MPKLQFNEQDLQWLKKNRISPLDVCHTCDGRKWLSDMVPCPVCAKTGLVPVPKEPR